MKKALVIFNPAAGLNTKSDIEGTVRRKLESLGYQVDLFYLNKKFEKNIAGHKFTNTKLMVAVGGDGTVNAATSVMLGKKLKIPLAIIPFGSANMIATTLGISFNVKKAVKIFDKVRSVTKIDVGQLNKDHYFLVGFSIGYISRIVTETPDALKSRLGIFGYLVKLFFNKIKMGRIRFEIKTKNESFRIKGNSLLVFNALNYFGLQPKRRIDFQDGIFNLIVLTNKTFFNLVEAILYAIFFLDSPRHVFQLDGNNFEILADRSWRTCQIDGDYIKLDEKKIKIKVLPRALKVVKPRV